MNEQGAGGVETNKQAKTEPKGKSIGSAQPPIITLPSHTVRTAQRIYFLELRAFAQPSSAPLLLPPLLQRFCSAQTIARVGASEERASANQQKQTVDFEFAVIISTNGPDLKTCLL